MHFFKLLRRFRMLATTVRDYRREFRHDYRQAMRAISKAHASLKTRVAFGELLTFDEVNRVLFNSVAQVQLDLLEAVDAPAPLVKSVHDMIAEMRLADARAAAGPPDGKATKALAGLQEYHRRVERYLLRVGQLLMEQRTGSYPAFEDALGAVRKEFEAEGKAVPYLSKDALGIYYNQLVLARYTVPE